MRIKGKEINEPNVELIILPRPSGEDIIFHAGCITSYDEFDALVPKPKPRMKIYRDGRKEPLENESAYTDRTDDYFAKRTNWMVLKSLQNTEELEWETVDMEDPETWSNYEKELSDSKISQIEVMRIINGVMAANGLDDARVEEAKERFLAGPVVEESEESFQVEEPSNT